MPQDDGIRLGSENVVLSELFETLLITGRPGLLQRVLTMAQIYGIWTPASYILAFGLTQEGQPFQKSWSIWVLVKIMVPFWGILYTSCRVILGKQKGTIIFTTTHMLI